MKPGVYVVLTKELGGRYPMSCPLLKVDEDHTKNYGVLSETVPAGTVVFFYGQFARSGGWTLPVVFVPEFGQRLIDEAYLSPLADT